MEDWKKSEGTFNPVSYTHLVNERNQATYENSSDFNNSCICIVSLSNDSGME